MKPPPYYWVACNAPKLFKGDCLEVMASLPDASVDAVICDPPYGTTACKWDSVIPFEPMWTQLRRIAKPNATIALFASQPFTSALVMSNVKEFRHEWVWDKTNAANFAAAKKQPLKVHEAIVVFGTKGVSYYPQRVPGAKNHTQGKSISNFSESRGVIARVEDDTSGLKYPRSVQVFPKHSSQCGLHPTQKPVALMEYLVKTYTNEGETVLDFTMGSGTTGVACINTSRRFIGIEREDEYYRISQDRMLRALKAKYEEVCL